ncbi:MAG: glutamate--tRNA ligase family protein, partial [Rubrobacteraceae bacterium]
HVIRGEEHIPNTARQTLLYGAMGSEPPKFTHLGLILGPDGKKLSKRQGDESVAGYRDAGYLPETLVNHLALLGWNHPEGEEEFEDLAELVREWDPGRLGASPATFDPDRLLSLNAWHVRNLSPEELLPRLQPFLDGPLPEGRELLAVEAVQQEMRLLSEAPRLLEEITGPVDPDSFAAGLPESSEKVFAQARQALAGNAFRDLEEAREFVGSLRSWAKAEGIKTRDLLHPLRLALTGRDRGPEMAYLFAVLGAEESQSRIDRVREARLRL